MKSISASEFRQKQKFYLDLATRERVIIHRGKNEAFAIVPLEQLNETAYLLSSDANASILMEAMQKIETGKDKGEKTSNKDLWK